MAAVNIAVFDSSTIDIPSSAVKRRGQDNNPSVAWGRQPTRGSKVTSWSGGADRPNSRTSTRGPTPDFESCQGGSPTLSRKLSSPLSIRKWAEYSGDKRSKAILDVLETRRATKQSESVNDSLDGSAVHFISPRNHEMQEEITSDKVITYPKFVVVHDKQENVKLDGRTLNIKKQNSGDSRNHSSRHSKTRENRHSHQRDHSQLKRDVDARRSFKSYGNQKVTMYDQTNFNTFGKLNAYDKSKSMENLIPQMPDNDLIMGFFPDDRQEYLQAKAIGTPHASRSASKQDRNESPGYHMPPPPTPASALLLSFGIDPEDRAALEEEYQNEMRMDHEDRRSRKDKMRTRDKNFANIKRDGSDPGVSHTSHRLLESQLVKHTFAFPEISPEMQRKSIGRTPRVEENQFIPNRSQSPVRPKTIGGAPSVSNEKLPTLEDNPLNHSEKTVSQEVLPGSKKEQPQMKRAKTTIGAELVRSNTFIQNRDKFSKLKSMGLPKVTLDIERNHFSRENLLRRSLLLREKFEIRDVRAEGFDALKRSLDSSFNIPLKMSQNDENKPLLTQLNLAIDMQAEKQKTGIRKSKIKTQPEHLQEIKQNNHVHQPIKDSESIENSLIKFKPPPNTPINGDPAKDVLGHGSAHSQKTHKKSKSDKKIKTSVGVSHMRMTSTIIPDQITEQKSKEKAFEPKIENGQIYL